MIDTISRVVRTEGLRSALRRSAERLDEALQLRAKLLRGLFPCDLRAAVLNVCGMPVVARLGGVPIQLRARLAQEARWRTVALWQAGVLEVGAAARRVATLETALARTGASTVHVEGCFGLPVQRLLDLPRTIRLVLSLHDLDLLQQPEALRSALLARAEQLIFPSRFLQSAYGAGGTVIEPASPASVPAATPTPPAPIERQRIAWVGSLKPHKGAALLPELIARTPAAQWFVFGGGDAALLEPLKSLPKVQLHGYYRAGDLPELLARQRIGLAVLPSLVPESFGLTLSECWLADVPAVVFDHGAPAQRIAQQGGGWSVPLASGAAGLAECVQQWLAGGLHSAVPTSIATALDAALAQRAVYARLGI